MARQVERWLQDLLVCSRMTRDYEWLWLAGTAVFGLAHTDLKGCYPADLATVPFPWTNFFDDAC